MIWCRRSTSGCSTPPRQNRAMAPSCCRFRSGARRSSTTVTWKRRGEHLVYSIRTRSTPSLKISLKAHPATTQISKSYVNCTEDTAMPHSHPWHPRLSEKLGLFRLVRVRGSHELCFTDPAPLAQALVEAGRNRGCAVSAARIPSEGSRSTVFSTPNNPYHEYPHRGL